MLSYRHSYHAGNYADVLKHIVLIEILEHLTKKDGAFDYIDTHAGAGLFNLESGHGTKLQEHKQGISRLKPELWPELAQYFEVIAQFNPEDEFKFYPGSPRIALEFIREQDKAWLYELHPADFELLRQNVDHSRRIRVKGEDGFQGLLALVPPRSRRGLVLIDPPYEIKTDYDLVVQTVIKAHKKFATGTYAIWYPVVDRSRINHMEQAFMESGIKDIHLFEVGVRADAGARGMSATGMIVINPPWTLRDKMKQILPRLTEVLAVEEGAFYRAEVLIEE